MARMFDNRAEIVQRQTCNPIHSRVLQRAAVNSAQVPKAPAIVHNVLGSSGQQMDTTARSFMESRFGHDFSGVRVHTDARAAESARAVNALAYTVGQDIVFGAGQYTPGTPAGNHLLAHELTHVIQQAPGLHRQAGIIPAGPLELDARALERARSYQPRLRPHIPSAPTIPAPPIPREETTTPTTCPPAADVQRDIRTGGIGSQVEAEMQRQINLGHSRAGQATQSSASMIAQADRAIRAEFGRLLPPGRSYTAPQSVTTRTPQEFAELRIPNDATARRRIGEVALELSADQLNSMCVDNPQHAALQSEVAAPLLNRRGLSFVREYERTRIGGQTSFPTVGGQIQPHVDIPSESRNMGHIVVHEGLHYYVNEIYRSTAEAGPLRQQLMEGGAEFLARHVINQRLSGLPNFQINTGTYASEFSYVATYLLRGGLPSFSLAYFGGRVDLLGLTPPGARPPIQPKLATGPQHDVYEEEANRMADLVTGASPMAGSLPRVQPNQVPWLQRQPDAPVSSPHDRMVVDRARRRLALLQRYVSEWEVREARRLRTGREQAALQQSRSRMDREGSDPGEAMDPGGRARAEGRNLARLNRRPLDIQITDQEVRIRIRFHVRFEDARLASRFSDLRAGMQAGADMVWNQEMAGDTFGGRRFVVEPQLTLIANTAARDQHYWLITVRPTDTGSAVYPGCSLPAIPAGLPTSVTDSNCDGGVMSIPPSHIRLGHVLGHELLHLFGLVDRYALVQGITGTGQHWQRNDPTRETGGRPDPLGAEHARILREDLAFLFDRLGIYAMEESRGLDMLRSLEREGLTIGAARAEIYRSEEIIRLGRDPHSLLPIRRDFNDRMARDAENL